MAYVSTLRFAGVGMTLATALAAVACAAPRPGTDTSIHGRAEEVQIGYGSQDRSEVTGAVVSVRAEDLGREVTSLEDLVRGLAGVSVRHLPSGGISLRIRGASSFSSDTEPLYVINGVPMRAAPGMALLGLNPRDISRIDVLKDAGATSIYGSRGANGVVLIFTKRRDADPPR